LALTLRALWGRHNKFGPATPAAVIYRIAGRQKAFFSVAPLLPSRCWHQPTLSAANGEQEKKAPPTGREREMGRALLPAQARLAWNRPVSSEVDSNWPRRVKGERKASAQRQPSDTSTAYDSALVSQARREQICLVELVAHTQTRGCSRDLANIEGSVLTTRALRGWHVGRPTPAVSIGSFSSKPASSIWSRERRPEAARAAFHPYGLQR